MKMTKEKIGVGLLFAGAITFFAYPQIVKMNAKKHPEKDYSNMTVTDKIVLGASVLSVLGGMILIGDYVGISETK